MPVMATGCRFAARWRVSTCRTCWASRAVWPCGSGRRPWAIGVHARRHGRVGGRDPGRAVGRGNRVTRSVQSLERPWAAQFLAVRVTPVGLWRQHRRFATLPRPTGATTDGARPLGNFRRASRPISGGRSSSSTKELGLDHFEGPYPGWHHHVVITAIAYAFLQQERLRPRPGPALTLPQLGAIVQEIFTGLLFISRPRYLQWIKRNSVSTSCGSD